MKIAVLGAGGFLGKYVTNFLKSEYTTVIGVTRDVLDLTDRDAVAHWFGVTRPDVVINLAIVGGKQRLGEYDQSVFDANMKIIDNIVANVALCGKLINVGSGAEFDISTNIDHALESEFGKGVAPVDDYGLSKYYSCMRVLDDSVENAYHLRLFGCFDASEPDFRLFKKFLNGKLNNLVDRKFDYISAKDFCAILKYYIDTPMPYFKQINCVYREKLYISEILRKFNKPIVPSDSSEYNYTGSGARLLLLGIPLQGLDAAIEEYVRDL